ncbi:hypothetical protein PIB30_086197 [Stylosanthes scabra]|uniref:Uncharacterized protein n=1 Tax=Stylosanthes scabra TaxID=79078 RepID=A0ABU6VRH5_9FABA|nr:hypothetical protein [Stylosanthes scabra]
MRGPSTKHGRQSFQEDKIDQARKTTKHFRCKSSTFESSSFTSDAQPSLRRAWLVFRPTNGSHNRTWDEFSYNITSLGEIGFEILDLSQFHRRGRIPYQGFRANALFGMEIYKGDIAKMLCDDGYYYDDSSLKVLDKDWEKKMNSNGVSISGYFDRSAASGTYQLKMEKVMLFSVYGSKFNIDVEDFTKAKPDILSRYSSAILGPFNKDGTLALKTLLKKKGLYIEGACFIGVDTLGVDVRISKGKEVKTYRFSFKAQGACFIGVDN